MRRVAPLVLAWVAAGLPATLAAQEAEVPAAATVPAEPHTVRWWHGAVVAGGLSALMLVDRPVARHVQSHRNPGTDRLAAAVRHFGQPEVYASVALGVLAVGGLSGDAAVTRAGGRIATALAIAGATASVGKLMAGRPRPEDTWDADGFIPFSGQAAMPSGHTAMAFALATSLSDEIRRPWASVGLYALAGGVAWSRVNDNRHWLSDVTAGAIMGITASKVASGRWRIFNLRPPSFLVGPNGPGLGWQASF